MIRPSCLSDIAFPATSLQLSVDLILSNSDPKNHNSNDNFFDNLYNKFSIQRVKATRMINSNAQKRGQINEIIIANY